MLFLAGHRRAKVLSLARRQKKAANKNEEQKSVKIIIYQIKLNYYILKFWNKKKNKRSSLMLVVIVRLEGTNGLAI